MKKLLFLSLILFSCAKKDAETPAVENTVAKIPDLYINTVTVNGDNRTNAITVVNTDYFDVSLTSINKQTAFIAEKVLEPSQPGKPFHKVYLEVVENGTLVQFKSSTDFLNFMSARGYEMVEQKTGKFTTDYTFKKKS